MWYTRCAKFLSTPSSRRATYADECDIKNIVHFYPRPPRGGRRSSQLKTSNRQSISIHALLAEGDARSSVLDQSAPVISIHALLAEGDTASRPAGAPTGQFLSTPSSRRATRPSTGGIGDFLFLSTPSSRRATERRRRSLWEPDHFYPRPPRGGRPLGTTGDADFLKVFLSTPSSRRATAVLYRPHSLSRFLSTPSSRRATCNELINGGQALVISIHALLAEGDLRCQARHAGPWHDFYPRPPRGGRPARYHYRDCQHEDFYPRPPRGGRPSPCGAGRQTLYFYPRPPRGGRPERQLTKRHLGIKFLSTPSSRRATLFSVNGETAQIHFYPRPPRGGRR